MRKLSTALFLFLLSSTLIFCQNSTRLVTITEGSPSNASGLGVTFTGKVMSDGNLYFRGSSNGLRLSVWKTDATIAGTTKLVEESSEFGYDWDQVFYLDAGVVINEKDVWSILKPGDDNLSPLSNMPNEEIEYIETLADGSYYFTTSRDDNLILHKGDATLTNITEIGVLHPDQSSLLMTAGSEGVAIYSSNSFVEDMPSIYLKATNEIVAIADYGATLGLTIADHTFSYIRDKFLFLSYKNDSNQFKNKIVDMNAGTVADFTFIRDPLDHFYYNDKFFLVTKREVISIDPNDLSHNQIFGSVFGFTPTQLANDKYYFISSSEEIIEVDLVNETAVTLENSSTGSSFYGSRMEYFENELFFIKRDAHQLLMRYDFATKSPVLIDTLSINNGATVNHALIEVNDELIFSRRLPIIQHELYVLGFVSSIEDAQFQDIKAFPTLTEDEIYIVSEENLMSLEANVLIFNTNGGLVDDAHLSQNSINVSHLVSGSYVAIIKGKDQLYRFRFIKN